MLPKVLHRTKTLRKTTTTEKTNQLVHYLDGENMYYMNTFFKKKTEDQKDDGQIQTLKTRLTVY